MRLTNINNRNIPFGIIRLSKMIFCPSIYSLELISTLKAFPVISSYEFTILNTMYYMPYPCSFTHAYSHIKGMAYITYFQSTKSLAEKGLIQRNQIGRNVQYTITQEGYKLFYAINNALEQAVRKRINEYQDRIERLKSGNVN